MTLFCALRFQDVETFIVSGNAVFTTDCDDRLELERTMEAHLLASLGFEVKTFVRTDAEVTKIAQHQPFSKGTLQTAAALKVAFLADPLTPEAQSAQS